MNKKWNIHRKEYSKIRIAVDIKSKEILSMEITADERKHDGKMLSNLVDEMVKSNYEIIIDELLADGAYDKNDIFRSLS